MKYWDKIPLILLTNIGLTLANNIGGILSKRKVANIGPILLANVGPTLVNNIGGILSKREVANIGPILDPIFIQYCTSCFTYMYIGPIFRPLLAQHWWNIVEAWNSQYWGNIYCNIRPILLANIWPILNFIINMWKKCHIMSYEILSICNCSSLSL